MAIGRSNTGKHPNLPVQPAALGNSKSSDLALAAEYREHAQELRGLMDDERPAWANDALMKAADDYDRMAKSLERIFAGSERTAQPH